MATAAAFYEEYECSPFAVEARVDKADVGGKAVAENENLTTGKIAALLPKAMLPGFNVLSDNSLVGVDAAGAAIASSEAFSPVSLKRW